MDDKKNSFVLYKSYLAQIEKLKNDQRGTLLLAIMRYQGGKELPEMDPVVDMLFDVIRSQMDYNTKRYEAICEKRAAAGRKSAERYAQQASANDNKCQQMPANDNKCQHTDTDIDTDTDTDTETEVDTETDIETDTKYIKPIPCAPAPKQNSDFEEFWKAYPKKVGKGDCRKIWAKMNPSRELVQKIMSTLKDASASDQWTREGHRFVPNPATWLRQGRWEDDVDSYPHQTVSTRFHNLEERRDDDLEEFALKKMLKDLEEG